MQMDEAQELRKQWIANGNPTCPHLHLDKEYYLGADTGDYVCTACGRAGSGNNWPEKERTDSN